MFKKIGESHDVRANVTTFPIVKISNVTTLDPTSRRSRMSGLQHHDVEIQHRDVEIQRRDVPEVAIFNVATLGTNVATLQRVKISFFHNVATLGRRDVTKKKLTFFFFGKHIFKFKSTPLFRF